MSFGARNAFTRQEALAKFAMLAGLVVLLGVGALTFEPLQVGWLYALAALTLWRPDIGCALLFISCSIDDARPMPGSIFVSLSEFELAACCLASFIGRPWRRLNWTPLFWGLPFAAAVLVSSLVNIEWFKVAPHLLRSTEFLAASFLAANTLSDRSRLVKITLAGAFLFYWAIGISQFGPNTRSFSLFGNPNQFGGYLILSAPFFGACALYSKTLGGRLGWGYFTLATLIAVAGTGSRAALLGWCCGLIVVVWSAARGMGWKGLWSSVAFSRRAVWLHLLILLTGMGLMTMTLPFRALLNRSWADFQTIGSPSDRTPYLRLGWQVWSENPWLGAGPGRWEEAVLETGNGFDPEFLVRASRTHSHSLFLQLGADLGLLGLSAFLLWLAQLAVHLYRRGGVWGAAGLASLTAFAVHNLADVTYPSLGIEFGWLLGAALAGASLANSGWGQSGPSRNLGPDA